MDCIGARILRLYIEYSPRAFPREVALPDRVDSVTNPEPPDIVGDLFEPPLLRDSFETFPFF